MAPPASLPLLDELPYTSSTVAAIMNSYLTSLSAQNLTLSSRHADLLTDFLAILTDSSNPSETILPPSDLLTTSIPRTIHIGTGLSVTQSLAAAIANAQHSVLFSTCFWAASPSRDIFADSLRELSGAQTGGKKIAVRIGFSSSSAIQKLLHTSSPWGKTHAPSSWPTLGLPATSELPGLDMAVKSIFYLPFSVLHSKFCIIDNNLLFLPSANISWETWLEQCTTFSGAIVRVFSTFWERVWGSGDPLPLPPPPPAPEGAAYPTIFLPHPHHRNPAFAPSIPGCFPSAPPDPPQTPQNSFLTHILAAARSSVYLQTPNLTSRPLLRALEAALERGVGVEVVTCRRMMIVEQFVTTAASASTEGCVGRLVRSAERQGGALGVWYYSGAGEGEESEEAGITVSKMAREAVQSHVKALIVDGEVTVLGSANGDRASWYTSQEANVSVFSVEFAARTRRGLVRGLGRRLEKVVGRGELGEVVGG